MWCISDNHHFYHDDDFWNSMFPGPGQRSTSRRVGSSNFKDRPPEYKVFGTECVSYHCILMICVHIFICYQVLGTWAHDDDDCNGDHGVLISVHILSMRFHLVSHVPWYHHDVPSSQGLRDLTIYPTDHGWSSSSVSIYPMSISHSSYFFFFIIFYDINYKLSSSHLLAV